MSEATAWFERLYAAGGGVPWDRGAPHPLLAGWVHGRSFAGGRALVVGCGLGEDAELVARLGFATTAFDIAPTAIGRARARFPASPVDYRVADLLDPPGDWAGAFSFVLESYTVQSLPLSLRPQATARVRSFVAPGGTLLVIAAGREPGDVFDGPPWPLDRAEVEAFAGGELTLVSLERDAERRWLAELRRAAADRDRVVQGETPERQEQAMGDENAADKERAMREHEREARERDASERRPAGEGDGDDAAENPAPPASVQEGNISGS